MMKSRREFLRDAALAAATIGAGALGRASWTAHAAELKSPLLVTQAGPGEPHVGAWKTWVLRSGRDIGIPRPDAAASARGTQEIAQLRRAQAERTQAQIDAAQLWDTGPATRRWTEIHLDMIKIHRPNPPRADRGLALVHLAMYDALVAAWHIKYLYNHPGLRRPGVDQLHSNPAVSRLRVRSLGFLRRGGRAAVVRIPARPDDAARHVGGSRDVASLRRHPHPGRQRRRTGHGQADRLRRRRARLS